MKDSTPRFLYRFRAPLIVAAAGSLLALNSASAQSTVTYTMQPGNFNSQQTQNNNNPPYAGTFANGATEIGQYANNGSFGNTPGAAAFENFTTTGVGPTGTQRGLQIGDSFTITNFVGANPSAGGEIAIAFQTSTGSSSFSSVYNNVTAKFSLYDTGGYQAIGATSNISSQGSNTDTTLTLTVTSSNTFNATISNSGGSVTYYDMQMSNSPSSTTRIQSFALYTFGDSNSNSYWKNASLTSNGTVTLGAGNGTSTISGTIADGLVANSASTVQANSLVKSGTGVITLSATNTYTGATAVNGGTLLVNGSTSSSSAVSVNSGGTLGGTGTVAGTVAVVSGGKINPGNAGTAGTAAAVGTLTTGALTLSSGSTSTFDISGGTSYDKIISTGAVTLGSSTLAVNLGSGTTFSYGAVLDLVHATSVSGTYTGITNGSTYVFGGQQFLANYTATDFTLTAIPEPTTLLGGALCLGVLLYHSRRFLTTVLRHFHARIAA